MFSILTSLNQDFFRVHATNKSTSETSSDVVSILDLMGSNTIDQVIRVEMIWGPFY